MVRLPGSAGTVQRPLRVNPASRGLEMSPGAADWFLQFQEEPDAKADGFQIEQKEQKEQPNNLSAKLNGVQADASEVLQISGADYKERVRVYWSEILSHNGQPLVPHGVKVKTLPVSGTIIDFDPRLLVVCNKSARESL